MKPKKCYQIFRANRKILNCKILRTIQIEEQICTSEDRIKSSKKIMNNCLFQKSQITKANQYQKITLSNILKKDKNKKTIYLKNMESIENQVIQQKFSEVLVLEIV